MDHQTHKHTANLVLSDKEQFKIRVFNLSATLSNFKSWSLFVPGVVATSDGTRVEPEPEKPGFMYENLNPGSENQNPGFSGFEVLLFQNDFHI